MQETENILEDFHLMSFAFIKQLDADAYSLYCKSLGILITDCPDKYSAMKKFVDILPKVREKLIKKIDKNLTKENLEQLRQFNLIFNYDRN
jgi:hypothetical protein